MRKIKLTESELIKIIQKTISEQQLGYLTQKEKDQKYGSSIGGGRKMGTITLMRPITMDSSLFSNGVDKIDTNSSTYQSGIDSIKRATQKIAAGSTLNVNVVGGASAVGSAQGYDNNALAQRRAQNFVNLAKRLFPEGVNFTIKTQVGKATVKNSPEANREQFVRLEFTEPGATFDRMGPAVDNTQLVMTNAVKRALNQIPVPKDDEKIELKKQKMIRMCIEVPENLAMDVQKFVDNVGGRLISGGFIKPRAGKLPGIDE